MTVKQTIEVPASHRILLEIPSQIPAGRTILTFTPAPIQNTDANKPHRKSISGYFGILSPNTFGDGVAYQRNLRDEWDG